ncbi:hypothetical protein RFM98_17640 [Mesorhizobium sp. VK9D]|uniref:hypothetical protein n=1 Tax=Mesorhizobium australafricanum TaxID=3072311 RepID=UPI002A24A327|nr:hypothetical protein [Mesorhizobium sp. VK9D]MDX8454586.1 hypothetical protein [Mesorhizobium sp. VK9D]
MPAKVYGKLVCLEPAGGALTGFLFLHEKLNLLQCAGIAAIIAAAFGTAVAGRWPVPSPASTGLPHLATTLRLPLVKGVGRPERINPATANVRLHPVVEMDLGPKINSQ